MSWKKVEFQDFIKLQRGFDLPVSTMKDGDVPVLGSNGIVGYHNEAKQQPPGVVTGRSGTLGVVQLTDKPFWPHNTSLWVKDFKDNNPRFVYYKLQTLHLERFNGGASVPTLNRNVLDTLPIRIPDGILQKRLADFLTSYDDLIENNRRRIQLLEQAARLLYKEWFIHLRFPGHEHVKIKDGVPEGWEMKKTEDVCETVGGGTPSTKKPEYWDGGEIPWVIPTDVTRNDCLVLLDSEKKITETGLKSSSARIVPPDTILMTSRASVGFFAIMDKEVCTNQGFINIIPNKDWLRMYLLHNLMSRIEEIRSHAGGTTYKEISKGRFRQMTILIPEKHVAQDFEFFSYQTLRQIRLLKKQQSKLIEARDILLPRLMNGDITA